MGKPKIYRDKIYNNTQILQSPSGSRQEILEAIHNIFDYMWNVSHQRLYVSHFTINFPVASTLQANDYLTGALQSWRRTMQNHKIPAEYLWGREKGDFASNGHPHFHVFVIVHGKHIQAASRIAKHLNALLSCRLKDGIQRVWCNSPMRDSFLWGKKVSAKLDNLTDAIEWVSYIAKIDTKEAPFGQKTFGFSKGFLQQRPTPTPTLTLEEERFEEAAFDAADLAISDEDWATWGYEPFNWEEALNFNPATGGPLHEEP